MFFGEYTYNLDEKGRIALPPKFRQKFAKGIVITRGLDKCLFAYPIDEWKKIAEKLGNLPTTQKNARAYGRLMLAGAMDLIPDKQGRIVIPLYLRKYAGLKSKIVICGLYNRVEIWDAKEWEEFKKKAEKASEEIAETLSELGI